MTVRQLTLTDFPTTSATNLAGVRAWEAWSRSAASQATVQLRGVGSVHIAVERAGDSAAPLEPADAVFGIERGGRWGRIALDGWLASRLVSAVLGRAPDGSLRPLGRTERGVLAALLATILSELAADVRLSLAAGPHPYRPADIVTAILKVSVLGIGAWVRLDVPLSWAADRANGSPFDGAALPVSGSLELASTHLPALEWATVRRGDAVVFDGVAPPRTFDAWEARLRFGPYAAKAQIGVDGVIHLVEGFQPAALITPSTPDSLELKNRLSREEPAMPKSSPPTTESDAPADVTSVLAAAPVEVVAEIGRVVLRGDEVMGLARGHVLTLGGARTTAVSLRVGDAVWARGELIDVDGELGVRVVELFGR
ncbi:MAG TPA: FliM/FliN family flagellar motor switch protein [Polyangia bacterium]|jgi:flagellar motor switch/type III secretory pathway protein FliN|nr:FliM/FliN family flagellar motor switch protein [Polyangia bacterium]